MIIQGSQKTMPKLKDFVLLGLAKCLEAKRGERGRSLRLGLKVMSKDNETGIWRIHTLLENS